MTGIPKFYDDADYQLWILEQKFAVRRFVKQLGREARRRYWPEEVAAEEQAEWWEQQRRTLILEERLALSVLRPDAPVIFTGSVA